MKAKFDPYPSEDQEHLALAPYLDLRFRYWGWYHPANERIASPIDLSKLKKKGVKKGFSDLLIFRSPKISMPCDLCASVYGIDPSLCYNNSCIGYKGMVIEMKRQFACVKTSHATREQHDWLVELGRAGWLTEICYGAQDAIEKIERAYGRYCK